MISRGIPATGKFPLRSAVTSESGKSLPEVSQSETIVHACEHSVNVYVGCSQRVHRAKVWAGVRKTGHGMT